MVHSIISQQLGTIMNFLLQKILGEFLVSLRSKKNCTIIRIGGKIKTSYLKGNYTKRLGMVFREMGVPEKLAKPLKNACQGVNFFSKVAGYGTAALLK